MKRVALVVGCFVVLHGAASVEARTFRFTVPPHGREVREKKGGATVAFTRIAINGKPLLEGDCYRGATVCFMYGEGVVVKVSEPRRRRVRLVVASERSRPVRVRARFRVR